MTDKAKVAKIVDTKVNTRSAKMIDNTDRQGETLGSVGPFVKELGMMQQAHSRHM